MKADGTSSKPNNAKSAKQSRTTPLDALLTAQGQSQAHASPTKDGRTERALEPDQSRRTAVSPTRQRCVSDVFKSQLNLLRVSVFYV